jgi:nucleotide-binding universal stress UspA family protein
MCGFWSAFRTSNAERQLALVEEHLRAQHPNEQIVREAEDIGANLIVMSCHSYGWLDRILHGSDAQGVLRRAPMSCPNR